VIPAHGPGAFLTAAVESALAEEPAEVLVVEDGTEGVDEASLGGARLLRLPHVRRSRARNAGVEAARTPLVAFLDEDDLCLPDRLEKQRASLEDAPGAVLSYGQVVAIDAEARPLTAETRRLAEGFDRLAGRGSTFQAIASLGGPLYTSATMVRRDGFIAAGGFDAAFDAHEDLDLYLRLARAHAIVPCVGGPVTAYRVHGANTPSAALYRGTLAVAEKHLATAAGADRRALLERRVDALWGLGEFGRARREAVAAALADPGLLRHPRFMRRLLGLSLPTRFLESRR
jgi:glycosyltransferase involved in cell wall biosynthesis